MREGTFYQSLLTGALFLGSAAAYLWYGFFQWRNIPWHEVLSANFRWLMKEVEMPCTELEKLEKRQVELRTAQGDAELPERKKLILRDDERSNHMAIADHKSFGHGGRPCPCK